VSSQPVEESEQQFAAAAAAAVFVERQKIGLHLLLQLSCVQCCLQCQSFVSTTAVSYSGCCMGCNRGRCGKWALFFRE